MNKLILSTVLIVLSSFSAFAGKIVGVVTEQETKQPLEGVIVSIKGTSKGLATDAEGKFSFNDLGKGNYELEFAYVTFKKENRKVSIKGAETITINVALLPENSMLGEVVVKTNKITNTENAVVMEIRKANQVVSGISALQIAKTMDRNAADVVKRVPGVSILEDRFIMVRGLYDRYNTTWLNDAGAPSAELDKKSFSFDLVPSGQIDRIMIYKTPAPELPGDFAGGMIKIYTTSLPDKNSFNVGVQSSFREYTTGTPFNYNRVGKTDWLGYDDGGRAIPSIVPSRLESGDANIIAITKSFNNDWAINQKNIGPDLRLNLSATNAYNGKKFRFGNLLGASYSKTATNNTITRRDFEQADTTTQIYFYQDKESISKATISLMENAGLSVGKSKFEFRNIFNQTGKSTVLVRDYQTLAHRPDAFPAERSYVMGYQSIRTFCSQLSGTHTSDDDNTKYTWTLGYTNLFKNQPDLRRIRFNKALDAPDSMYASTAIAAQVDPVYGGGRFFSTLKEHIYSFNHNIFKKININKDYSVELNAGNYLEYKDRAFDARLFGYFANGVPFSSKRQSINNIFATENVGDVGQFKIGEATTKGDSYSAENKLFSSYVSLNIPIGKKIKIVGGVRHEINTQSLHSFNTNDKEINTDITTQSFLPSVNIAYNLSEKSLLRLAYGKSLNRPEFREQASFYFYDNEDRAGLYGAMFPSLFNPQGNPLKVANIDNLDARWEYYPSQGEMIQLGVFYKNFVNPIQKVLIPGGDNKDFTFVNAESAKIIGFEAELRKNLNFIDDIIGTKAFSNFTLVGNVSLTNSTLTIGNAATDNKYPNLPTTNMQGQSPYVINIGTYYQSEKNQLKGSLLYNVFGARVYSLGLGPIANLYEIPFHSLDFNLEKTIFKNCSMNIGIQNLLNGRTGLAYDMNNDKKIDNNEEQYMWKYYRPGRYCSIGFKFKF